MRAIIKYVSLFVVMLMLAGPLAVSALAQDKEEKRPVVIVRPVYYDPFFYDPFYRSYYRDRYFYRNPRQQIVRELAGNERELEKHLAEYHEDGVITAKERKELEDDYKDVRESRKELERYNRYYGGRYYRDYRY